MSELLILERKTVQTEMHFKRGANVVYKNDEKFELPKVVQGLIQGGFMGWLATPLSR